jgi:hypothetical protein
MRACLAFCSSRLITVLATLCFICGPAMASDAAHYVVTNDDSPPNLLNGISIYNVGPNGNLTYRESIRPGGNGIGGGFFGMDRIRIVDNAGTQCIYFSQAFDGNIVGITMNGSVGGIVTGSSGDGGTTNGIGLAVSSQYLYAGFSDFNTIGTFLLESGCNLMFVSDTPVVGLQAGVIDAITIHGNIMVVTYGDGSIESFNIAGGTPVSNGDEQNSTAAISSSGATYPSAVDITQDGHFAIFGDTSTAAVVEVSDISSGQLTKTVPYQSVTTISSSNIMLSPDETLLYVIGTQGDRLGALFFDKTNGTFSPGCESGLIRGYSQDWSYLGGIALASNTGTGEEAYIAEFGAPSSIAMVRINSAAGKCSLSEAPNSPVADPYSPGLLSVGSFPPRSF